jgi:hypothetical protein
LTIIEFIIGYSRNEFDTRKGHGAAENLHQASHNLEKEFNRMGQNVEGSSWGGLAYHVGALECGYGR